LDEKQPFWVTSKREGVFAHRSPVSSPAERFPAAQVVEAEAAETAQPRGRAPQGRTRGFLISGVRAAPKLCREKCIAGAHAIPTRLSIARVS
jgi:hypothetical protein